MSSKSPVNGALDKIQAEHGFLPKSELKNLATQNPEVTLHRLNEVATFFPHYRLEPVQGLEVRVCRDMACHLAGAKALKEDLRSFAERLGTGKVVVGGVSCLGQCDGAPIAQVGDRMLRGCSAETVQKSIADSMTVPEHPLPTSRRVSPPVPTGWTIDPYEGREDYSALSAFADDLDTSRWLATLRESELRGMGGAGVFVHQKWTDVRQARGDVKFVVVNGDESEPATFKDREILLRAPSLVLEGLILAGLAVGATQGFIYVRHEYHDQISAVRAAIVRAEERGLCGRNILGTGRSFPVEVFVSPGGYICGEQSALIEAMEGKRAEPRNKPPTLETNGLQNRPTLVGNVESFAWVPAILANGGRWYRDLGVNGHVGMRFFSLSGDLNRPGVQEVPIGTTLRELVERAGGVKLGKPLKAVAPSGPSGGFLPARLPRTSFPKGFEKRVPARFLAERFPEDATDLDILDLELDLQLFRDLGLMLGSGIVVYAESADMLDQARNASEFFRNESCGKCVPCRIGSEKTVELAADLAEGQVDADSLPEVESLMGELQRTMEVTSICGLGAVASNPMASVFRYFRDDLTARLAPIVREGRG